MASLMVQRAPDGATDSESLMGVRKTASLQMMSSGAASKSKWAVLALIVLLLLATLLTLAVALTSCQKSLSPTPKPSLYAPSIQSPSICPTFFYNSAVNNIRDWLLPAECEEAVKGYMTGDQYMLDLASAIDAARTHFHSLEPLANDGKDMVIMDIDQTSLSNVGFFAEHHWGTEPWDFEMASMWHEWVMQAKAKVLRPTLVLYKELRMAGWQVAFITGRTEDEKNATIQNLSAAGYSDWQSVTFRSAEERNLTALEYKSQHRVALLSQGFRIWGNVGDQWSDLLGPASGPRTFKLPNPMYYVA